MGLVTRTSSRSTVGLLCALLLLLGCRPEFERVAATPTPGQDEQHQDIPDQKDPDPNLTPAEAQYFRLMVNDDASTTAVIGFGASTADVDDHRVYIDTVDHGQNVAAYRASYRPSVIHVYKGMNNAFVRLKSLQPDTAYYFVVADPAGVSKRYWFRTAPATPDKRLSIIAGGDSRNNRVPRQNANLLVAKLRPHAVMFGGDMTASGYESEWRDWFEDWQLTIAADGRMTPVIITRGNHEASNDILVKLFDTSAGVYYGVTLGGDLLRVYTLNSESGIGGAQTTWLAGDLAKNAGVRWKFAQYHRPMRPHASSKGEGVAQYDNWAGLFHRYRMSLVSESDAHTVKTTWPLRPTKESGHADGFVRDDATGTVYIGEGCWGAPLRTNNKKRKWTRDSGKFNHFSLVFVDKSRVEVRTIRVDNAREVASVTDADVFRLPANLDVWSPANGSVITLKPVPAFAERGLAGADEAMQ